MEGVCNTRAKRPKDAAVIQGPYRYGEGGVLQSERIKAVLTSSSLADADHSHNKSPKLSDF